MKTNIMAYASEIVDGKVLIAESTQDEPSYGNNVYEHLDYLLEDWDDDREYHPYRYLKACWDLESFTAPLFRLLSRQVLETLSETKRVQIGNQDRIYKLFYIKGKVFGITGKKRIRGNTWEEGEINLYGISQYFPELGNLPKSAVEVAQKGEELMYALERMGIINPNRLTSPCAMFQDAVLLHMKLPTIYDMSEDDKGAAEYALKLADGEWRTVYKIGFFNQAFDFDLNSGYPWQVSLLPDTTACRYTHSDTSPSGCDFGLVQGVVEVNNPYTPVLFDDGEKDIPRVGSWEAVLTTELVDWLYKHKAGKFEMKDGWFLKFLTNNRPFEVVVNRVFNYRQGSEIMNTTAKSIAVGLSGKFGEDYGDGYGKFYNPIYRAMVLTRCKIQVADFIWQHKLQPNVVSVTVDGVLSDRNVDIKPLKKMGEWRFSGAYPALILGPGMQWYGDKKPLGLTYDQVVSAMREHPKQGYYGIKIMGRQTLTEALKNGDLKSLGEMREYEQSIDLMTLNPSMKFDKLPRTGEQALNNTYEAMPYGVKG